MSNIGLTVLATSMIAGCVNMVTDYVYQPPGALFIMLGAWAVSLALIAFGEDARKRP